MDEGWQEIVAALASGLLSKSMWTEWTRRVRQYTLLAGKNFYSERLSMWCIDGAAVFHLADDPPEPAREPCKPADHDETEYDNIVLESHQEHPREEDVDWLKGFMVDPPEIQKNPRAPTSEFVHKGD